MDQLPLSFTDPRKASALAYAEQRKGELFRDDFGEWLAKNWHIYTTFEKQADRIWNMGRRHYSARTILHWIRHETTLRENAQDDGLKINNNWSPDLARLYVLFHPERAGFFEKRVGQSARRAA
jgi:hypothetical protein